MANKLTYAQKAKQIISKYEKLSSTVCETCGEPGQLRQGGWLATLCDNCVK